MTCPACPSYDVCAAPLCPLDQQSLDNGIWYLEEDICRKQKQGRWVQVQKRINKRFGTGDRGYFTLAMLKACARVGKLLKGLDPDAKNLVGKEAAWIKAHSLFKRGSQHGR